MSVDFKNIPEVLNKYPWLRVKNRWSGEIVEESDEYTEYDMMEVPSGWKLTFIPDMIEEIDQLLKKANFVNDYTILQVKEKYGTLRWYDGGFPSANYQELQDIINKYEEISAKTCATCGKFDDEVEFTDRGWVLPLCKEHMK